MKRAKDSKGNFEEEKWRITYLVNTQSYRLKWPKKFMEATRCKACEASGGLCACAPAQALRRVQELVAGSLVSSPGSRVPKCLWAHSPLASLFTLSLWVFFL